MLCATIRLRLKSSPSATYKPCPDTSRLLTPDVGASYSHSIREHFHSLDENQSHDWAYFKTTVSQSADEAIGHARPQPKKPWISVQTLEIIEQRRAARLRGDLDEYRGLNKTRNVAIAKDREAYWRREAEQLETAAKNNNMSEVFKMLRRIRAGPRHKSSLVKDTHGNIISIESDCIARWQEHFSQLLHHPPVPLDPDLTNAASEVSSDEDDAVDPVTLEEVSLALKSLKNNKAPGICAITAEMIKAGGDCMLRWLTHIINHVWVTELLPSDWTRGVTLPFWKRKGDRLVCSNHRGITLLSIPGKLFTRILLTRALSKIRDSRRPQQAGFMPNRSTTDHISALRLLIEKYREFRKDRHLFIAFMDLKAAFDTVDHASLWSILRVIGIPPKIVNLFQKLYGSSESCIRVNGKESSWFSVNSGVRQGCVAASDLFNCVIDYLMNRVCNLIPSIQLNRYMLSDLEYADDTALQTFWNWGSTGPLLHFS